MNESTEPVSVGVEHWSLHKGFDSYELLAQVRPTDAFDAVLLFRITQTATDVLAGIAVHDGRVPNGPATVLKAWLRSDWRWEDDGSLAIEKRSTHEGDPKADDVMLLITQPVVVTGGVR